MAKKVQQRSFDEVLTLLGSQKFDVAPAQEGAAAGAKGAVQVRKYGSSCSPVPAGSSAARSAAS